MAAATAFATSPAARSPASIAEEIFDCTPLIDEAASFFYGNREYSDLPRKHKITIATCAHQCNAPAINCIALVGTIQDGRHGYALRVGGGLSTVPRISKPPERRSSRTKTRWTCSAPPWTPGGRTCSIASPE